MHGDSDFESQRNWRGTARVEFFLGLFKNRLLMNPHVSKTSILSKNRQALLAVRRLRSRLAAGGKAMSIPTIPRAVGVNRFPMSFSQQRLWIFNSLEPNSPVYNNFGCIR